MVESQPVYIWFEQHSAFIIFTPLLSQSYLNILSISAFHFLYITCLYALVQTQYDIYISIWNVINFLCHSLEKSPTSVLRLPDQFYYSTGDFLLILKYSYLSPVKFEVLSYRHRIKKALNHIILEFFNCKFYQSFTKIYIIYHTIKHW